VFVGGATLGDGTGDSRHGKNQTQAPQDILPFAIIRRQHNGIGASLEHASQRATSQDVLSYRGPSIAMR
jgi:hypothetical protein